jgi:hypothetical protein
LIMIGEILCLISFLKVPCHLEYNIDGSEDPIIIYQMLHGISSRQSSPDNAGVISHHSSDDPGVHSEQGHEIFLLLHRTTPQNH